MLLSRMRWYYQHGYEHRSTGLQGYEKVNQPLGNV